MKMNPTPPRVERTPELMATFEGIFNAPNPRFHARAVMETGTYEGTGTTLMIAEVVRNSTVMRKLVKEHAFPFYTFEVDPERCKIAKQNLRRYRTLVSVKCGLSVDYKEALKFIKSDDLLKDCDKYPDIYYDSHEPIKFYTLEVTKLSLSSSGRFQDNLILKYIDDVKDKTPLFVLDSCGGIGWMEYELITRLMIGLPYYCWCHDINHVKHVRSFAHMNNTPDCEVIAFKEEEWVLGRFNF